MKSIHGNDESEEAGLFHPLSESLSPEGGDYGIPESGFFLF